MVSITFEIPNQYHLCPDGSIGTSYECKLTPLANKRELIIQCNKCKRKIGVAYIFTNKNIEEIVNILSKDTAIIEEIIKKYENQTGWWGRPPKRGDTSIPTYEI